MNFISDPKGIENESMSIIRAGLKLAWSKEELLLVQRIIHTSGDPSLEEVVAIHPKAIEAGVLALKANANIICDVEMVRAGISKGKLAKFRGKVECFLNDPEVEIRAKEWGLTRSMTALRLNASKLKGSIVVIGNAPTALYEALRLAEKAEFCPALIIGIPVGFVGAKESKELLWSKQEIPSVTVKGTRGGSPIAATVVNALLQLAF